MSTNLAVLEFATVFLPPDIALAVSDSRVVAFMLCLVASGGTFLGGIATHFIVKVLGLSGDGRAGASGVLVGVLQAFSAGVMLYMTFMDLLPEATAELGGREVMVYFFVGVAVFGLIEAVFDFIDTDHHHDHGDHDSHHQHAESKEKEKKDLKKVRKNVSSGNEEDDGDDEKEAEAKKADALREKKKKDKERSKSASASASTGTSKTVDINSAQGQKQLMRTSLITFWALLLHNMPEGLGVYLSALSDPRLGLQLAVAICLHNIPEGMAVAIPLYASGGSTPYVLAMTLVNGLAEPLGVIVGVSLFGQYLTPAVLSRCLAAVGGIMCCISIHELQPTAIRYAGQGKASFSLFLGMFVVFLALEAVTEYFGHPHSHGGSGVDHHSGHGHSHGGHGGHGHSHESPVQPAAVKDIPKAIVEESDEIKWGQASGLKLEKPVKFIKKTGGEGTKAPAGHGHSHSHGGNAAGHSHSHSHGGHAH
ncbi:ZIP zinc transporter-domain-containing protein [Chytriomyces cf. hyalinus JEL632]|nr:ZIP zinc transporter-domain-containing protein [Chytriomyces cf. hyalinus JEL632]